MSTSDAVLGKLKVILPSCCYPKTDSCGDREAELLKNIVYLNKNIANRGVIVCDNGLKAPKNVGDAQLIYTKANSSSDPSIGECYNLLTILDTLRDDEFVLKLHARCRLRNIRSLIGFMKDCPEFFLVNRNVWSSAFPRYDCLPYVETRVFASKVSRLRRVLIKSVEMLELEQGRLERACLAAILSSPFDSELATVRGSFYPVFDGLSGHGRDYNNRNTYVRALIKSKLFRVGL